MLNNNDEGKKAANFSYIYRIRIWMKKDAE